MYVPVNTSTFVYFMVYECELDMCSAETSCRSVAPSLKKCSMTTWETHAVPCMLKSCNLQNHFAHKFAKPHQTV